MGGQVCALCGEANECVEKEIDGQQYDIRKGCWSQFAKKL
jgi:hypothetical protein